MNTRKKALFCLTMLAGAIIGTSVVGKGSSAYADWDDWGHRGGYFRGPYQQGGFWGGGYRPVNYGWGQRAGWGGGYRPYGGWNRGGWGNRPWGGWAGGARGRRGWW